MKTYLKLGGVVFCLDSERTLDLSGENLSPFLISPVSEPDITVTVTWDWQGTRHPSTPPLGRDMIQIYYREGEDWFCENDGGDRGALSCVRYREDSSHFLCAVNEVTCQVPQNNLLNVIRMLPIRGILRRFDVVFLHASQIAVGGKGILFTAPSGTGKTTQARLWQLCRGADILCNDRTLLRRVGERWMTYGVPFDGSAPVCSGVSLPLGAIIHLVQGECDRVERISGLASLQALTPQLVMDTWDPQSRSALLAVLASLLNEIPVYRLTCTPEASAVDCLEQRLRKDKVIQ